MIARRLAALFCLSFATAPHAAAETAPVRQELRLDQGWQFRNTVLEPGMPPGAGEWRAVSLPHDWSIEGRVNLLAPSGGNGGYFPTGAGVYRRELEIPASWQGRRILLRLDGSYRETEVRVDGEVVASQPYGYTPILADLGGRLVPGRRHSLEIRVDNSRQPNSRWYSGSGLYRHVWLTAVDPVSVAPWGVFARTLELGAEKAVLAVSTRVENQETGPQKVRVVQRLLDAAGRELARAESELEAGPGAETRAEQVLGIDSPQAWSPETPILHTLVTQVWRGERLADELRTSVGLRTLRWSAQQGLELNGRRIVLNGGNLHHDNGPLGAAAFDRAEERKAELMKAAGFNAVRTAHNPPSTAFLDACDRLGLLVMDEAFDGWEKRKTRQDHGLHFRQWWRRDLDAMVLRDRNHASVICWSIGNEVFERGTADGHRIAAELAARIRELDTTRPVTAGINDVPGNWAATDPLFASLDLAGYNYETARHSADHERLPARVVVLTESYQNEAFVNARTCALHTHVVGDFVWSALDYLGEAGIGRVYPPGETPTDHWSSDQWPWHGAACGDIDLTGWRKPSSHWRAVAWGAGESLYAAVRVPSPSGKPWATTKWSMVPALPTWSWPGQEGKKLELEIYSSHPRVRVSQAGRVLAEAQAGEARACKAVVEVTHAPGDLVVEGLAEDGRVAESLVLQEAGPAARLSLRADRTVLRRGGQDLAFVTLEINDEKGRWQPHQDLPVTYTVEGAGTLAGIGSGDLTTLESYRDNPRRSHQGRSLVIVRTTGQGGKIVLRASAPGLKPAELELSSTD